MDDTDQRTVKLSFLERVQNVIIHALGLNLRRLGPFGGFLIIFGYAVDKWAKDDTKDLLIRKYVLNADKIPGYIENDQVCAFLSIFCVIALVCIIVIFRKREMKLREEVRRISREKTGLHEKVLGKIEHAE